MHLLYHRWLILHVYNRCFLKICLELTHFAKFWYAFVKFGYLLNIWIVLCALLSDMVIRVMIFAQLVVFQGNLLLLPLIILVNLRIRPYSLLLQYWTQRSKIVLLIFCQVLFIFMTIIWSLCRLYTANILTVIFKFL